MKKSNDNRNKLFTDQTEELLRTLKTRFAKNMTRHEGLEWTKVQARLEAHAAKLWSLSEMERTGGEPDVVGKDEKTGEYIFLIALRRVLSPEEVFVTIAKQWSHGKNINRKIMQSTWPSTWVLSFYPKNNTVSCKNWGISIRKRPVG
jgi:hypothetical protein